MNGDTPVRARRQPRGPGCFLKGCLTLFIVCMVMGMITGGVGYYIFAAARPLMTEQPGRIRIFPATDEQYQAVLLKMKPFGEALDAGRPAALDLTADDLNVLIALDPHYADVRGKLFLAIADNHLVADVTTPVNDPQISDTKVYFTGRLTMDASVANGEFTFILRRVEGLDGSQLPPLLARFVTGGGFAQNFDLAVRERIRDDQRTFDILRRLRTGRIEGNHIVVTCGDQPAPVIQSPGVVAARPLRE